MKRLLIILCLVGVAGCVEKEAPIQIESGSTIMVYQSKDAENASVVVIPPSEEMMFEMPSAEGNENRVLRSTEGKWYYSDGRNWFLEEVIQ